MSKKEKVNAIKMKKSYKIIIAVLLVIAIGVGGYLIYENKKANAPLGTDWADMYFEYIESDTIQHELKNCEAQFVPQEDGYPLMVLKYASNEIESIKKELDLLYIDEDNKVNLISIGETNNDFEIKLLYNKEEGKYKWYKVASLDGGNYIYRELEGSVYLNKLEKKLGGAGEALQNKEFKDTLDKIIISFDNNQLPAETIDETTPISKFEKIFVIPENVPELKKVNITDIKDPKQTKEALREAVKGYKTMEQVVTKEVKQSVTKEIEKLKNREETIKKKAEEDAKKKADAEAKKKAEEAKKGLKVGGYTIKYGTYVGESPGPNAGEKLVLKQNGQCEYKGQACTYTIGTRDFSQDPTPDYRECLIIAYGRYTKDLYPYNASTIGDGDIDSYDYSG